MSQVYPVSFENQYPERSTAMTQPHICPVCKGEGEYKEKTCHGCEGKGFVWAPEVVIVQPVLIEDTYDPYKDRITFNFEN